MLRSLLAAFSFGTVLPVRGRVLPVGRGAITAFPAVGIVLGCIAGGVLWIGHWAFGNNSVLAGALAVTTLLLVTRGLHIDGLADTVDGLGCYGPPERALQIMREGSAGPFGVAAIAVIVVTQAAAFTQIPSSISGFIAVVTAVATGRVAAVAICRRSVPPASGSSLGSLVAGSQSYLVVGLWIAAVASISILATARMWQGPVVVLTALALSICLAAHCVRRFGGITGDVLGASVELATTLTAIGLVAAN
jgi:adenosylcobinamide-GDP ribazoletransferase